MLWSQQLRKLVQVRRYMFVAIMVLGVVLGTFGNRILGGIARLCPQRPVYRDEVSAEIRERLDFLFDHGLLYCGELSAEQAFLAEPVYWGSDGIVSAMFFQPETLRGVGVMAYAFGDNYLPSPPGDSPQPGFNPDQAGQPVYRNQAPDGAGYYYREQGAPADDDFSIEVTFRGPAADNQAATGRNLWRDLNRLNAWLHRQAVKVGERTTQVQLRLPVLVDRWQAVRGRWVNPELADEKGSPSFAIISGAELPEPILYQAVNGPFGSTVWVAGVVTGTHPALALTAAGGGPVLAAVPSIVWSAQSDADVRLAEFAFAPQASDIPLEARYWHEAAAREGSPPDFTWPVTFPAWHAARVSDWQP